MKTINADALSEEVWAMARKVRTREMQTVLMAIERLIHATENVREFEWISMRDEQPEHDGKYLTFHGLTVTEDWIKGESLDMLIGLCSWYKDKGGWYSMFAGEPIKTVTHWMELPAAPEGWG